MGYLSQMKKNEPIDFLLLQELNWSSFYDWFCFYSFIVEYDNMLILSFQATEWIICGMHALTNCQFYVHLSVPESLALNKLLG